METGSPEDLKRLYEDVRKDGVRSVRYDWRWNNVESAEGAWNEESLSRYAEAARLMKEAGLEPPTVILSSIPSWALEIYKSDKEKFFSEFEEYCKKVAVSLSRMSQQTGEKVARVQVLNELNNSVYTPIAAEDVKRVCEITRAVFREYNPEIKLIGSLFAGNVPGAIEKATMGKVRLGEPIEKYLEDNQEMLDTFDALAVDYYPGMWHIPLKEARENERGIFKQFRLLQTVMEKIAAMGKEYEIGEVGIQTNIPLMSKQHNEDRQRYFYDVFFRELKHLLLDFRERNIPFPKRVGLYEAVDEAPKNIFEKIKRRVAWPEHDMGMRRSDVETRKEILKGSRHISDEERAKKPSQLSKIIGYMNAPMRKR